jgi:hypothetical protein
MGLVDGVSRWVQPNASSRTRTARVKRPAVLLAALALGLASCGVHGPAGNSLGGIIPWSPEAERGALGLAQSNCGRFNEFAVITTIHRVYGDYIVYECRWKPSRR